MLGCLVQSPCDASTVFNTYFAENLQIYMLFVSVRPSCSPNLWQKHDQFLELQWKSQVFTQVIIFASKAYEKRHLFFAESTLFLGLGWNRHHLGFLLSFNGGRSSHLMTAVVATPSKSPDLVARFRWNWHFRDEKFDVHPSCFIEKPQNAMSKACEWSQVATLQYHKIPRVCCWLVVDLPLWKIWKSNGSIIPNIWKNKSHVPNHQPGWIWVKIHGFPTAYGHWFGFHGFHAPEFTQQMATF